MFAMETFVFGVLLPVLAVALVCYGVWELVRSGGPSPTGSAAAGSVPLSGSARSILDERFARGELDAEEYVSRRALLDGTVPSPPVADAAASTDDPSPEETVVTDEIDVTGTGAPGGSEDR